MKMQKEKPSIIIGIYFILLVFANSLFAEPWSGVIDNNLNLTQNAYSDNWQGSEVSGISWQANSNTLAQKQLSEKINNRNTLKLSFGQTITQDAVTRKWLSPEKTADLIDLESVFRVLNKRFFNPFFSFRLESQFMDNAYPEKSRVLDPMRTTESAGIARVFLQENQKELISRLGLAFMQFRDYDSFNTSKNVWETITSDEIGISLVTDLATYFSQKQITLTSRLSLFQALIRTDADNLKGQPNENYWKDPDINWDNTLTISITKLLEVNFYFQLMYDKEVDPVARIKQNLGLGLSYKINI